MTRHIGTEVLASYREGAVGRRKAAKIRRHLTSCPRCAGINSDLAAVSGVLAGVHLPGIPENLAARLQGALAAEVAARAARTSHAVTSGASPATGQDGPAAVPGRPDLPVRRGRVPRQRTSWLGSPLVLRSLAAAGVVVILVGGGYLFASDLSSSGPASTANSSGVSRPGHRAAAAAPQLGQLSGLPYADHGTKRIATTVQSRVNFEPATLASQVRQEVARLKTAHVNYGESAPAPTAAAPQPQGVNLIVLEACISLVADGRKVVLVELARYEGNPATVIVAEAASAATRLFVTVVGAACSAARSDVLTRETISR